MECDDISEGADEDTVVCKADGCENGLQLSTNTRFCINCSAEIPDCDECDADYDGNIFCKTCGGKFELNTAQDRCLDCPKEIKDCKFCDTDENGVFCTKCKNRFAYDEKGRKCEECENDCKKCKWVEFTRNIFGTEVSFKDTSCLKCDDDQDREPVDKTTPTVYVCKNQ